MSDEYLFDRSGPPDPEIEGLENLLAGYRYRKPHRVLRALPLAACVAAAAAVLLVVFLPADRPVASFAVRWLETEGAASGRLALGDWLETGEEERARIVVADIGTVDVQPGSRLRLVNTGSDEHRLRLERGRLTAEILAPPRLFLVETPSATAVDLGCSYSLSVEENGRGLLEVTSGYVLLERHGLPSAWVPAGASCRFEPGRGPGLPWFQDAPDAVRAYARDESGDVATVLGASRSEDTLTLWHLLPRLPAAVRETVFDRIASLAELTDSRLRPGVLALSPSALEELRDELSFLW